MRVDPLRSINKMVTRRSSPIFRRPRLAIELVDRDVTMDKSQDRSVGGVDRRGEHQGVRRCELRRELQGR